MSVVRTAIRAASSDTDTRTGLLAANELHRTSRSRISSSVDDLQDGV